MITVQLLQVQEHGATKISAEDTADIKFGYCTEFIILTRKRIYRSRMKHEFKEYLASIGDSIVCVADDDVVKIHVHTNDPGLAIQKSAYIRSVIPHED